MSKLTILLLGSPHLHSPAGLIKPDRRKGVALLAYLVVNGESASRESLATLLWPNYPAKKGYAYLRRALWSLSKKLPEGILDVNRQAVGIAPEADVYTDVVTFREHSKRWKEHHQDGSASCAGCIASLQLAADIYRDDFLTGFTLKDSPNFDEWQARQTERLRQLFVEALEQLVIAYCHSGELNEATERTKRWLATDPYHETAHRILMHLFAMTGRPQQALMQYESCVSILTENLGIMPAKETTTLYEAILDRAQLPSPPIQITEKIPLARRPKPYNIPVSLTSFVGRVSELEAIETRLKSDNCRLLSLTGQGGIGKTTLSISVAHRCLSFFADGIFFVPLAHIDVDDMLVAVIAETLGFQFQGQEKPTIQLITFLQDRHCLLILDNFEHLLSKVQLITQLLQELPRLKFLVTSRERLQLKEEWTLPIKGLTHPHISSTSQPAADYVAYDAVQLFLDRGLQAKADWQVTPQELQEIAQICQVVAGIPLALELAAAWVRVMSVSEIQQELTYNLDLLTDSNRNAPDRHQSLRAVFDQSWNILTLAEQRLFRQLSVFRGSFTLKAARRIIDGSPYLLANLVDKSLLTNIGSGRFHLPETLRQYASEKLGLDPTEKVETKRRHSNHYAKLALDQGNELMGSDPAKAAQVIELELSNLRQGWRWAISQQLLDNLVNYVDALSEFYELRGLFLQASQLFASAIKQLNTSPPGYDQTLLRFANAKIQSNLGHQYIRQGELQKARKFLHQSLDTFVALDKQWERAVTLSRLGYHSFLEGSYDLAQEQLESSLRILQYRNDSKELGRTSNRLGIILAVKGDYTDAKKLFRQSIASAQRTNFARHLVLSMHSLGNLYGLLRDSEASERYLELALAHGEEIGDRQASVVILMSLAQLSLTKGNYLKARQEYQHVLNLLRQLGDKKRIAQSLTGMGWAETYLENYDAAQNHLQEALQIATIMQAVPIVIEVLVVLAKIEAQIGDLAQAATILTFAMNHEACVHETKEESQVILAEIKPFLSPEEVTQAENEVKKLTLADVLAKIN